MKFGQSYLKVSHVDPSLGVKMDTSALDIEGESKANISSAHSRAMMIQKLASNHSKEVLVISRVRLWRC